MGLTLPHDGETVREFYALLPAPVVGIETIGTMGWFRDLMEDLGVESRVGHPAAIRKPKSVGRSTTDAAACRKPPQ